MPSIFSTPGGISTPYKYYFRFYLALLLVLFFPFFAHSQFALLNTNLPAGAVAWADYDNDGDLDILIANSTSTKIYRNLGNGTFDTPNVGLTITPVENGHVAWADYDNDGDIDFLLTGDSGSNSPIATIYRNEGNGTFTTPAVGVTLQAVQYSSADWGDYDNDGDLDLIVIGSTSQALNSHLAIYTNNGNGTFTNSGISLGNTQLVAGNVQWGDFDNDGDLDILISGTADPEQFFADSGTKLYQNQDGNFTEYTTPAIGVFGVNTTTSFWTDADSDGDLDFIITGNAGTGDEPNFVSRLYINQNKDNTFVQSTSFSQTDVVAAIDYDKDGKVEYLGTKRLYEVDEESQITEVDLGFNAQNALWIDFNNDGRLDICTVTSTATKIYRNLATTANINPSIPSSLSSRVKEASVSLSWNAATDTESPNTSLSYNVYIGSSSEGSQKISPMAVNSVGASNFGFRKILKRGNAQSNTSLLVKNLPVGTYYWSVQALDQSGGSSFFTQEQAFEIKSAPAAPDNLQVTNPNPSGIIKLTWEDKSDNEEVFEVQRATTNNDKDFVTVATIAAQLGTGGTVTYEEDNTTIQNSTQYYYRVKASNTGGTSAASNVVNVTSYFGIFSPKNATQLVNLESAAADWGDLDNDGDLDLITTGRNDAGSLQTTIYLNNGGNTFTQALSKAIVGVSDGGIALGDYDADGDIDILISGSTGTENITRIYANQGNLSFIELLVETSPVRRCSVAWGDYDNDGDLDAWVTGLSDASSSIIFSIYRNEGNNQFTEIKNHGITAVEQGSLDLGDFDNDGQLDVLVTGRTNVSPNYATKVFRNKGDGTFEEANLGISLENVVGSASWGDYDNDGDLDILLIGDNAPNNGEVSKIYKNNGNGTFQEAATLFALSTGNTQWIDYDNDGDLDALIAGYSRAAGNDRIKLYTNNGNDTFTENTNLSIGEKRSGVFLVDYDKDLDVDFLHLDIRFPSDGPYTKLIRNETANKNTLPTIPANLTSQVSKDTVILQWDKSTDTQTAQNGLSYNVRIGTVPGKDNIVAGMSNGDGERKVARRGFKRNQKLIRKLNPGTYYWSVQALDHSLQGSDFAVEGIFKVVSAPVIPTLSSVSLSSSTVFLFWTEESDDSDVSNYVIERSVGNASNFQPIDTISSLQGSYEAQNLTENTLYYFRIYAYNTAGNGQSNIIAEQTNNLPRSPQKLVATTASASQINLTWVDVAATESGFIIYRKSLLTNNQFEVVDSLKNPNQSSYNDTKGLIGNVAYTYEVRAYNTNGVSGEPEQVSITTPIDNGVALPPKPLNFFANPFSPSQISLEWSYTSTAANSFVIERSSQDDSTNYKQIAEIPAQTLRTYSDTVGLIADKIYYYRMRAKNSGGLSDFSEIALAKAECNLPIFVSLAEGQVNQVCVGQGAKIEVTADLFQPTYQWKRNGVKIPNANAQFYVAYQTGEYTCEVSSGSCTQTTKSAVVIVVKDPLTVNISSQNGILIPSVTNAQTYTWYYNLEPITGATGVNFTPTANGKYYLVIEKDGCSATSNIVDLTTVVGLTENDLSRAITLSPNPASDVVEVSIRSNLQGAYKLWLINAQGNRFELANGTKTKAILKKRLQLKNHPAGVYQIMVEFGKQQGIKKLLKQ